jgi:hypothetical protein
MLLDVVRDPALVIGPLLAPPLLHHQSLPRWLRIQDYRSSSELAIQNLAGEPARTIQTNDTFVTTFLHDRILGRK